MIGCVCVTVPVFESTKLVAVTPFTPPTVPMMRLAASVTLTEPVLAASVPI